MLTFAGNKLLRQKEKFKPNSDLILGYAYRDDRSDKLQEKGFQEGQSLLLKWLPKLRQTVCDATGQNLYEEYRKSLFQTLTSESLFLFIKKVGETLFPLASNITEVAILTAAFVLKRGLASIVKVDGISIIETEAYIDFDLKIFDDTIFAFSSTGEISEPLKYDLNRVESCLSLITKGNEEPKFWREFGDYLWSILFNGEIRNLFERCYGIAKASNRRIRLRLAVENPKLIPIPWELARYPATGDFLAISNDICITRYLHKPTPSTPPKNIYLKNLALFISSPTDQSPLNSEKEASQLQSVCEQFGVKINKIEPPTSEGFRQELENAQIEAFHYIGHGMFENDTGYLLLENSHMKAEPYSADRLATILGEQKKLHLVFLSSCEGATSNDYRSFIGIAPRLVQKGIPTVVAMQYPVFDDAAILFAQEFYKFLSKGFPAAHAAQKGRQAIFNDIGDTSIDFITPVIFISH
jgi:hypothetical protein